MNKKTFDFIGTPSSDGDYFCFEVDKEIYKSITGKEPIEYIFADKKKTICQLYPDHDLFGYGDKSYRFKIEMEEV